MNENAVNEVVEINENSESNKELYTDVTKSVFNEMKSVVKGKVYVSIEPKVDKNGVDTLNITILNFGIKWKDSIRLYDGFAKLMSENLECVKTIVVQSYEKYRTYVLTKFFVYPDDVNI